MRISTTSYQDNRISSYLTDEFVEDILDGKTSKISGDMTGLIELIADIFEPEDLFPRKTLEQWAESNEYITEDGCDCEECNE